jgi:hypothetical protein
MRKHRFSAIMTGNQLLEGKNANFYINLKKKETEHEKILNETLKNLNLDKSTEKGKINEILNETFLNESFGEIESKKNKFYFIFFIIFYLIYLH